MALFSVTTQKQAKNIRKYFSLDIFFTSLMRYFSLPRSRFCLVTPRCVTKTAAKQTYEILTVFGGRSGEKFCSDTVALRCICQDSDAVLRKLGQVLQFCCSCSRGNILCFKSVFPGGFFVNDTIPKDNAVLMVRGDWAPVNEEAC